MDKVDAVKTLMSLLEGREFEEAAQYLTDDFSFEGWTPAPLNKVQFLDTMRGLKEGLPGLIFNLHNVEERDAQSVTGTIQATGYQSDNFILPALGLPPIPQTANSVSLPAENVTFVFAQDGISRFSVQHVPGGGIHGLIRQLGIEVSIEQ